VVKGVSAAYEAGAFAGEGEEKQTLDQQTVAVMEVLKAATAEALDTTLEGFPDVRQKMEVGKELNFWERRVADSAKAKEGGKSFEQMYEEAKKQRTVERKILDGRRRGNKEETGAK
jgi:hypothetical protein